jgi:hypothetical protein
MKGITLIPVIIALIAMPFLGQLQANDKKDAPKGDKPAPTTITVCDSQVPL